MIGSIIAAMRTDRPAPRRRWRSMVRWLRIRIEPDYETERQRLADARARYEAHARALVKEINADLPPHLRRGG